MTIIFNPNPPPEIPSGKLNVMVKEAVLTLMAHYRARNKMFDYEPLTENDINKILDGVRDTIYRAEGIVKKKNK